MKLLVLTLSVLISSFSLARVQGGEGHGGGAFVCRDNNGDILKGSLSVELQDLWEGITISKFPLRRNNEVPWSQQLDAALEKLRLWKPDLYEQTAAAASYVLNHRVKIPDGASISAPQDAKTNVMKKNCPLEGVVTFNESSGEVLIDETIVEHMGPTDFAALMMHESIYKALRILEDEKDSIRARRYTAFLFSSAPVVNPLQGLPTGALYCKTVDSKTSFALYSQEGKKYFQLEKVQGYPVLAITKVPLPVYSMPYLSPLDELFLGAENVSVDIGLGGSQVKDILAVQSTYEKFVFSFGHDPKTLQLKCSLM